MLLVLLIVLVLVLGGGAWGYRRGNVGFSPVNPLGLVMLVLIAVLLIALFYGMLGGRVW